VGTVEVAGAATARVVDDGDIPGEVSGASASSEEDPALLSPQASMVPKAANSKMSMNSVFQKASWE
jgi:hypothetical protein